ncbi:MAG: hypothetical protein ACLU4N_00475 [Butyricimonas faecihominis]
MVDYDRPFKVVAIWKNRQLLEGIDFEIELDSLVIKAGTSNAKSWFVSYARRLYWRNR